MTTDPNDRLVAMIRSMVSGGHSMTRVRADLEEMFGMSPEVVDDALAEYERRTGQIRTLRRPASLRRPGLVDWYPGPQPDDTFWPPLKKLLEDKGWDRDVVQSVDDASSKILSQMQPRGVPEFQSRGLVLGYVQSGKTTNFTALISKAADVGYKLFIVLSGVHNKLRTQTQDRLYSELVALNTENWIAITDSERDFTISGVGNVDAFLTSKNPGHKILGVVKKNATVLTRLRDWLRGASDTVLSSCPILIIDDEADQASLNNTSDPERRSRVNSLVLELLGSGTKVAYVGYTATPFANIFIDPSIPEDLYPSDFIVDLPRPDNYFGAETLFGREAIDSDDTDPSIYGLDMIRTVPHDELDGLRPQSAASRHEFEPTITPSLRDALNYFWLATAARRSRGDLKGHSGMLVHTTLYVDAHLKIKTMIENYRQSRLELLKQGDPVFLEDLKLQWNAEGEAVDLPTGDPRWTHFEDLKPLLEPVLKDTVIPVENNQSAARLSYKEPGSVQIVVGGNVLSRGLTLEGLTVSYFIRTSTAYDTLLQMGRWFGYRVGYEELPRVWMTDELGRYFHDLATVEREIRSDIARYEQENITPMDFAVRVRTHPKLSITAKSKMASAVKSQVSYDGKRLQTILFREKDRDWLLGNQSAARWIVEQAVNSGKSFETNLDTYRVARGISSARVLEFLERYQTHPESHDIRTGLMSEYIRGQNAIGDLKDWNVVLATQQQDRGKGLFDFGHGVSIPKVERSQLVGYGLVDHVSIGSLLVTLDWVADLPGLPPKNQLSRMAPKDLRGKRPRLNHGSLVLYPIARDSEPAPGERNKKSRKPLDAIEDVIGLGVIFPATDRVFAASYMSADLSHLRGEEDDLVQEDGDEFNE